MVIIGVVVGAVVLIIVGLCVGCNSKRKRTLDRETRAERIPVTTRTSASHRTQPSAPPPLPPPEATAVNPFPAPEVGYSPVPIAPPPAYPYPLESPPPYPGGEGEPQYPPPGESYPWLQSSVSAESPTSTTSPWNSIAARITLGDLSLGIMKSIVATNCIILWRHKEQNL